MAITGSSPLARGLPLGETRQTGFLGIIPARAGFTSAARPGTWRSADHPRSRGVYGRRPAAAEFMAGSSPLARGLLEAEDFAGVHVRIIPARAGFTNAYPASPETGWDHPRSRGVYLDDVAFAETEPGSSPLARGLRPPPCGAGSPGRIIPARAGFTKEHRKEQDDEGDHPRSRGVYIVEAINREESDGSSPLARGLRGGEHWFVPFCRIIPARAGFTPTQPGHGRGCQDHPRSRGVYRIRPRSSQKGTGSSPLARGLLRRPPLCHSLYWDHPRSRGVYSLSDVMAQNRPGSSPLARGLHITGR